MKRILIATLGLYGAMFSAQSVREVGEFSSLKVYDRIHINLVKSNTEKVEIQGDSSENVEVINKNGELKIRMNTFNILQGNNVKVTVYFDDLEDIQASQGSIITSDDVIEADMLKIVSNEGSQISLKVHSDMLNIKANSGGILNISGKTKTQDSIINSGAILNAKDLYSDSTLVSINAGGTASVYANKSVNAKVRAGGNIHIYGNPKNRNTKKIAGGTIVFK